MIMAEHLDTVGHSQGISKITVSPYNPYQQRTGHRDHSGHTISGMRARKKSSYSKKWVWLRTLRKCYKVLLLKVVCPLCPYYYILLFLL